MNIRSWFKRTPQKRVEPTININVREHFFTTDVDRLLAGWDTQAHALDYFLRSELAKLRARSRRLARLGYGKRYVSLLKQNIVSDAGFRLRSLAKRGNDLDKLANEAIENHFREWSKYHVDLDGRLNLKQMLDLTILSLATDGEMIFEIHRGSRVNQYGFALKAIDPELLDVTKNEPSRGGNSIRLGVEYNGSGKVVRYHFRTKNLYDGDYNSGRTYTVEAENIIHLYLVEGVDQSRGIPWITSGLEKAKHVEKYGEAAIVRARSGASRIGILSGADGSRYRGDEPGDEPGVEYDLTASGEVWDIGDREFQQMDGDYPGEMYEPFMKVNIRELASAWNVSYTALSGDLSDTSFASSRTGILEEREFYKDMQSFLISCFLEKIYPDWLFNAYAMNALTVGDKRRTPLSRPVDDYLKYRFQGRRWGWVDPDKDSRANERDVENGLNSRRQIIASRGDNPDEVFEEIEEENARFGLTLGKKGSQSSNDSEDDDNVDSGTESKN